MTSYILTSGAVAIRKAGAYANATITASGAALQNWSDLAEGRICAETRRDWVGSYSGLSTNIKNILSDVASSLMAKEIIAYDMSGYTSRAEAQTMLSMQDDIASTGIAFLKEFKSNEIKTP